MKTECFNAELEAAAASNDDSCDSSAYGEGGQDDGSTTTSEGVGDVVSGEKDQIAIKESRHVFWSRIVVLTVLLLSAVCISLAVYFFLAAEENNEFATQVESDSTKVLESMGMALENALGSVDAFTIKLMAYARDSNSSWPLVAMPDFAVQATKFLRLSKAFKLAQYLLVYPETRKEWEDWSFVNYQGWVEDSLRLQENDPDFHAPVTRNYNASYSIEAKDRTPLLNSEIDPEFGAMLPKWQQAPLVFSPGNSPHNFNGLNNQYSGRARWRALTHKKIIISEYNNVEWNFSDPDQVKKAEKHWQHVALHIPTYEDPFEPNSAFAYPIVEETLDSITPDKTVYQDNTTRGVGVLGFTIRWRELIKNILPSRSSLIVVFHQEECGGPSNTFTYQLHGPEPEFLGAGDLHDSRFDGMVQTAKLADLIGVKSASSIGNKSATVSSTYSGLPLDEQYCAKSIAVYPSAEMENTFNTSRPLILALVAPLIFVFTSIVFLLYDFLVARRQRLVMQQAIVSTAIVSSIYPEQVKEQVYKETQEERQLKAKQGKFLASQGDRQASSAAPQIADSYDHTTVFLADIYGFTPWSTQRTPSQVFEFLETIYGAFDSISVKRKVFKVEAIGDCYVAVTGIPHPQNDHAVRMVKFARECLSEMDRLTCSLAKQFGEDTDLLQMRVGINSGAITGGVLRCSKARFALFGDTINTASRMQKHGEPGRIHISESTAHALARQGKQHWLTPREEKIQVKGKGEMQSYWATNRAGSFRSFPSNVKSTASIPDTPADDFSNFLSSISDEDEANGGDQDDREYDEMKEELMLRIEA